VQVDRARVTVSNNLVSNFAGDGMRGNGDFGLFEFNRIENSIFVDENHDDMFQAFVTPVGSQGSITGVVLRNNVMISFTEDHANPALRSPAQGIGCFDGFYDDWVVENNLVVVDHWHGITFEGARNVTIVNNTVIDMFDGEPGPSWILVADHKDGRASSGNVVQNNLVNSSVMVDDPSIATEWNNLSVDDVNDYFLDADGFDFRLRAGSPAVDAGRDAGAPATDITGAARPQGAAVDVGAYEFDGRPPAAAPGNFQVTVD
ncbi:MAG: right-handed parallel beta-helix repeat-containing protein, partial [Caulobacterales bacterium]|nr:right-handed parallel beta-helix repeat-containing protein [Caulobacterales bacterium]